MSEENSEAKVEVEAMPSSAAEKKIEVIQNSKMPESEKVAYIERIKGKADEELHQVPFKVYVSLRKVPEDRRMAMKVFPKAKSVRLATLKQWDEIFKDF